MISRSGEIAGAAVAVPAASGSAPGAVTLLFTDLAGSTELLGRIGDDAAQKLLGPTGETRFVERLFIGDNSALPNGLGGPNPTLTTQALATRTAENIFVKYFHGDRWVGSEAPVVSTDPRVTAALLTRV